MDESARIESRDTHRQGPGPRSRRARTTARGRTIRRSLAVALLVLSVSWAGLGTDRPASAVTVPAATYQLSLGDSLTAGWGASTPAVGYANQLVSLESAQFPGLQIENLACPAETTTTMLEGGGWCSYPQGSQLGAAQAFLAAHPGQVRYITIDIGINNVDTCPSGSTIDASCVASGISHLADDLPAIIAGLHRAAPGVPIVGANSYDPFLAGDPTTTPDDNPYSGLAGLSPSFGPASLVMMGSLNTAIESVYRNQGVDLVDIAAAFQSEDPDMTGTVAGGPVPQNVSDVCGWSHMCDTSGLTIHLNDSGESVFADQFALAVDGAVTADADGTWLADAAGGVHPFGDAPFFGELSGHLDAPIVSLAPTQDHRGYWLVAADGGVFAFGDAGFYGSTGGEHLDRPVVGMAATPDGHGYWLVAADGGVFAAGDAGYHGSTGGLPLVEPVVGMTVDRAGTGYSLASSDGGLFTFGGAPFDGSLGANPPPAPVVAVASS